MLPVGSGGAQVSVVVFDSATLATLVATMASSGLFSIDMKIDFSRMFKSFNMGVV